ncbi:Uma2 family endonuclease [Thermodesulfatator autotrophicus]|uniref:Putative restriction endonuclease domain-containing protein n=1 Tax=Thermodesulfatator autotrophicus TaxID=1795632 RepID=A0A177ECF4_9BACT|nr:Uma2 family endonuclease [Thermodesulfatator autotrophicus]OAG28679.1 hypothetical protein TH606_00845 [Thermodesulfatator autotrophicus]
MEPAEKFLPRYTVKDYNRWEGDWELIEGIPYAMMPSPFWRHQRVSLILAAQIEEQLEGCPENCFVCQDIDWIVDETTVLRPDIVVVCDRIPEEHLKNPPEVIFEIVSPSTAFKDEKLKFFLYEKEKVKFYALVYPELKKMRVFELKEGKYDKIFDSDEGEFTFKIKCSFRVNLSKIWQRI